MLNKQSILEKLQSFPYDKTQYWIITGAALVLYDIRETAGDIDMGCTSALADRLESEGYPVTRRDDGTRKIAFHEEIEIFENWGEGHVNELEGIPVLTIDALVKMKYQIGREKDIQDIALIRKKYKKAKYFLTCNPMNSEYTALNPDNQFIMHLAYALPKNPRTLFICSDPASHEKTDKYANIMRDCFLNSGFSFSEFLILDGRNEEQAAALIPNAEFILLAGGHVPTQNAFFHKIGLREKLRHSTAVVLGFSAGAMNMADIVYAQPELDGEAVSKEFRRFLPGLGFTKTMMIPHYQLIKEDTLDGMRLFEDITYPDSMGRLFYALVDGSFIEIDGDVETLYGEAYLIQDAALSKIQDKGCSSLLSCS